MKEDWLPIKGFEDLYEISSLGNLRSIKTGKLRKLSLHSSGYLTVILYKEGKIYNKRVNRLVAEAFKDTPSNVDDLEVNHINHIKTDNRESNLEYLTPRENSSEREKYHGSGLIGARWHKRDKKWVSGIRIKGKEVHLGYFDSELQAHQAYQNKLKELNK